MKEHSYALAMKWIGNDGEGTKTYRGYRRDHLITATGKASEISGSSDASFRGDKTRFNPEELLVAALSSCHMLAYLHLCAEGGVNVVEYEDSPIGTMKENSDGSGEFSTVTLKPRVKVEKGGRQKAVDLHDKAHHFCFIARSVNFDVTVQPEVSEA